MTLTNTPLKTLFLCWLLIIVSAPAVGDDVIDSINEAIEAYNDQEFSAAVESLNYASQLIQQKKGEGLSKLLPEPLEGWTSEQAGSESSGGAVFGGGISVSREYRRDSSSINIQLLTDSPMMQGMLMMFSNPMLATSDGGKLERIKRQKAIVKYQPGRQQGEINIVVDNRILVTIKGRRVTREELVDYAKAINYRKIKAMP